MPTAMKVTKYFPISERAKAWTDCTTPERVRKVPRMQRKKVVEISTMFQTFIMPFFSCIMTECRKAVPESQGSREAFSRSEEHTSELQSLRHLVCRLLLEKTQKQKRPTPLNAVRSGQQTLQRLEGAI